MEETKGEQWFPFGNGGGYGGLFESRVPRAQGLLLGTDSSMSSEGILKAAVHGTVAAQRFKEGERLRKRMTMPKRNMACSQVTMIPQSDQSVNPGTTASLDK